MTALLWTLLWLFAGLGVACMVLAFRSRPSDETRDYVFRTVDPHQCTEGMEAYTPLAAVLADDQDVAGELVNAQRRLLRAEAIVERRLDDLFPGGWKYFSNDGRRIDVYGVNPLRDDLGRVGLHYSGFEPVTEHEHDYGDFRWCACSAARRAA